MGEAVTKGDVMSYAITHVADTALWVAAYRSAETKKLQALFRDPLAGTLAGARGHEMAKNMPFQQFMEWFFVIRTVAIDRLITRAVDLGVDAIVNLGAGLDTRPYRMSLPHDLCWIEIDFPHTIDYKNKLLHAEKPVCELERIALDVLDVRKRQAFFARLGSEFKSVLVLTEGVVHYLAAEQAASLSKDLLAVPEIRYWVQDFRRGGIGAWAPEPVQKALQSAPFKFDVADWVDFFAQHGWSVHETLYAYDESVRVGRQPRLPLSWRLMSLFMPVSARKKWQMTSGYVLYDRCDDSLPYLQP